MSIDYVLDRFYTYWDRSPGHGPPEEVRPQTVRPVYEGRGAKVVGYEVPRLELDTRTMEVKTVWYPAFKKRQS